MAQRKEASLRKKSAGFSGSQRARPVSSAQLRYHLLFFVRLISHCFSISLPFWLLFFWVPVDALINAQLMLSSKLHTHTSPASALIPTRELPDARARSAAGGACA